MMKKLIYILEDDDAIRVVLTHLLSDSFVVSSFANVHTFMHTLAAEKPDLYLLDINLPDGNGLEVAEFLAKSADQRRPILVMSAQNKELAVEKMQFLDGFIQKPFSLAELKQKIHAVMFPT